ncbi:MAG: transposase [Proteobacteria bacterium]|nr:transposase [Pseudomonadota bacterium]MBU1696215.1 transposase [Pseudomonadota bacterium]
MPRRPRIIMPGVPIHIIQRGNNRQACFFADEDYQFYLDWVKEYSIATDCAIHAYVLMTNHVHLLLTPAEQCSAGDLMKRLGQRYVQYINRTYKRSGSLWEGRYRSCIAQQENYLLICQRYIELNPVRAGMVKQPGEYPWSSYRVNAQGEKSDFLNQHMVYLGLGDSRKQRELSYRKLFQQELSEGIIKEIRQFTNGNFVLGSDRFKKEISKALGRRVTLGKSGRPRKSKTPA